MNLKKLLPFENYVLTTKLPVDEVRRRLTEKVEPRGKYISFTNQKTTKPYRGQVNGDSFAISRIINYRNSFLPEITGHFTTYLGQTQIEIKMRPVIFVVVFMLFWLGVVGLACIGIILAAVVQFEVIFKHGFSPMILIPFGMFLFGSLLIGFGFKTEANNSKEFLAILFEGEETQ